MGRWLGQKMAQKIGYPLWMAPMHSAMMRNLMKVWKTWTGPLRGGRAWSKGPKSALSEILQNKEHFY